MRSFPPERNSQLRSTISWLTMPRKCICFKDGPNPRVVAALNATEMGESNALARLEGGAADVFGPGSGNGAAHPAVDVKSLHAKIGELTLENDSLRNGDARCRLHGLKNKSECLGARMQIPKKRRRQMSAPWAGEQIRMPWRADADS